MRRITVLLITVFAFAVPWEYSLDVGEPLGNVARIVGLLTLAASVPAILQAKQIRRPGAMQWLVLSLFTYWVCSYFWTVDGDATTAKMRAYFQVMMTVWLLWEFVPSAEGLRDVLRSFVAGCWVLALLTFLNFSSADAVAANQIRFVAEGQDPNDVARFLDLGIPLGALLFVTESRWSMRALGLGYLPVSLAAVLLTASRGGFSGSLVAMFGSAILFVSWRPRAGSIFLGGLAAIAGFLWMLIPRETVDRLATIPEQIGSSDLNDRLSIWTSGWHAFVRQPWWGFGAGSYSAASGLAPGDTAHNTLMASLVTGGLIGTAIFVAIYVSAGWSVARNAGLLRWALGTTLVVWTITAMVGSVEENRTTWLLFGAMSLAGRLALEEGAALRRVFSGRGSEPQALTVLPVQ